MPNAEGIARTPIDAEELAAFIDGRLAGERRRRVIERLAEDEEAYELYSTVIEVREAMAAEAADGPVPQVPPAAAGRAAAPFPAATPALGEPRSRRRSGKGSGWWRSERSGIGWLPATAAIAAGTAVAVGAGWWMLRPTGSRELLAAFDADTVNPSVARDAPKVLEAIDRGPAEEKAAQFKLGARAFDLALAVETGDRERSLNWLDEMSGLLEEVPYGSDLHDRYEDLAARLEAGATPRSLRRDVAATEKELETGLDLPDQPLFAFGRWLAAVRTAAAHGDRRFLASPAAQRPLQTFRESTPSEAITPRLEEIGAALGAGAADADLGAVAEDATWIIKHCAAGRLCLGDPLP